MIVESLAVSGSVQLATELLRVGLPVVVCFDWLEQVGLRPAEGNIGATESGIRTWLDEHKLPNFGLRKGKER